jgi:hypothetical protein
MSYRVVYDTRYPTDVTQCHGHTLRSNRRCRRQVAHQVVNDGGSESFMAPLPIYCPWHREQATQ